MAKKNVNRAKQYKHQNRHLLKKAVATVAAAVKEAPKKVEKAAKAVAKDAQKPEATLNGVRLTENANTPIFTVYRGATFNPELKVWDTLV